MRKIRFIYAALAMMSILGTSASASTTEAGIVQSIIIQQEGVAFFTTSTTAATATWPSCAATKRYAINTSSSAGQALLSALITAQKSQSMISVIGKGVCDLWGDSESVEYIAFNP